MNAVRILPRDKTVWHKNRRTGEEWSENVLLKGFEVWGGLFAVTTHTKLCGAEKEKALRESINKKFPFVVPRSQRELDKARRLGL